MLQRGKWNGKQVLPESWVQQATSKQVANGSSPESDWEQGYGFQFWRCRHNAFRGDGKDGQFCIVMPEQNAVLAITANTRNLQGVLNVVWDKLLPAFSDEKLSANETAHEELLKSLKSLKATR